eukprot:1280903-Amorphochlora_amoeboformis.AAC.1
MMYTWNKIWCIFIPTHTQSLTYLPVGRGCDKKTIGPFVRSRSGCVFDFEQDFGLDLERDVEHDFEHYYLERDF